jgi:hypothetical protein
LRKQVLYATRFILRGEELCDCYIELRQSTAERQEDLSQWYRFTCSCLSCRSASSGSGSNTVGDDEEGSDEKISNNTSTQVSQIGKDSDIETVFTDALSAATAPTPTLTRSAAAARVVSVSVSDATSPKKDAPSDDENRAMAMKLDKKMMRLAEEGQVQQALKCAVKIIQVRCVCCLSSTLSCSVCHNISTAMHNDMLFIHNKIASLNACPLCCAMRAECVGRVV